MRTKPMRFDYYQPFGDLGNPEATGLIAGPQDFDFGTPNLERHEDVVLVASNTSMKQCLKVHLKWRPSTADDTRGLVTLISSMTLVLEGTIYEFKQIETYKPMECKIRSGRYTQYGSNSAKLKLFIPQPYRRTRLVFNGHMQRVGTSTNSRDEEGKSSSIFVKLSCVMSPVAQIFDFLEQYDETCLKQIYANNKKSNVRTFDQLIKGLLSHDRHEQKVRLVGEYLVLESGQDNSSSEMRKQETFALYGFHARHFSSAASEAASERNINTRRLYGYLNNGQAFHLGTRTFDLDQVDFGYTGLSILPKVGPIDKPYKLDWSQLSDSNEFQLELSGQGQTFSASGKRQFNEWFEIEMNGKPGWAYVSQSDSIVSTPEELEAISRSLSERQSAISCGQLMKPLDELDNELDLSHKPLIVSIKEDCCSSSQLVGSKAASLAQLRRFADSTSDHAAQESNYEVPFAFVLTRFAHDLILEENELLRQAIDELQQFVGTSNHNEMDLVSLKERCKSVADLVVEQTKLPQRIEEELWSKLVEHYGSEKVDSDSLKFAVRSSSWGEDEEGMSAAGQLSTMLNVAFNSAALVRAIRACFASKFNYENIEYKRQHGLPLDLPMAVVVQEMVACDKAGVMFTCEPTTGDESLLIITANYGLGESVVSAQADPDSIIVRTNAIQTASSCEPTKLTIEKISIGAKNVIISSSGNDQASNNQDRSKCCLSEEEILRLADCGLQVKRFFWSQRRDIEWGYLGNQLYLFQSRPVTGLESYTNEELLGESDRPSQAELGFYTRANVGEVMPYAITPLTLTYSVFVWNTGGARMFLKYSKEVVYVPQCSSEVFQVKYHTFFNLRCSILLPLSDAERSVLGKAMEIGFFGREMGVQPDIIEASKGFVQGPNPFHGTRFNLRTLPLKLMPNRIIMREKVVMDKLRLEVRALKLAEGHEENKMLGLYNQMRQLFRYFGNCWENHICIIMFATNNNIILQAVLSKYIKDPMQLSAASNKFLALTPDVISAEIPDRVSRMAKLIQARGAEELEKFVSMKDIEALAYLQSPKSNTTDELTKLFAEFLERFGHRCYNEFELSEFAWRERPQSVAEMIRQNCAGLKSEKQQQNGFASTTQPEVQQEPDSTTGKNSEKQSSGKSQGRPKTIDEVLDSLEIDDMSFKDRMLIKHVLVPKCQQTLAMREKTKNILVLYTDILREASRMLAEELQRQLRIPDKDLFYYFMFDELAPLIRDYQPTLVCQAIRRRQMFKRSYSELWKFDEIISDMTPLHMKPTRELTEAIAQAPKLRGTPASSGKVQGKICLVNGYKELDRVQAGSILLTHSTDIAFSPVFPIISGIITEVGGLISHGAVVAREYGLPSVIGIPDVTRILQDGEEIILDADNGAIIRLSKQVAASE